MILEFSKKPLLKTFENKAPKNPHFKYSSAHVPTNLRAALRHIDKVYSKNLVVGFAGRCGSVASGHGASTG